MSFILGCIPFINLHFRDVVLESLRLLLLRFMVLLFFSPLIER